MLIKHNESDTTVSGRVNLTYHIDCYHHVLAFEIEANGTISKLATRGEIESEQPLSTSHCLIATPKGKNDILKLITLARMAAEPHVYNYKD